MKVPDVMGKAEVLFLLAQLPPAIVRRWQKSKWMLLWPVHQTLPTHLTVPCDLGSSGDFLEIVGEKAGIQEILLQQV